MKKCAENDFPPPSNMSLKGEAQSKNEVSCSSSPLYIGSGTWKKYELSPQQMTVLRISSYFLHIHNIFFTFLHILPFLTDSEVQIMRELGQQNSNTTSINHRLKFSFLKRKTALSMVPPPSSSLQSVRPILHFHMIITYLATATGKLVGPILSSTYLHGVPQKFSPGGKSEIRIPPPPERQPSAYVFLGEKISMKKYEI